MRILPIDRNFSLGLLMLALALAPFSSSQEKGQPPPAANAAPISAVSPSKTLPRKVRRKRRSAAIQTPSSQPSLRPPQTAAQLELQRQKDRQLLKQQQADSQRAQQEQDAEAGQLTKQKQAEDSEPRIQDAPGPAQTGVIPGVPPQPQQTTQGPARIQDAPGPAQTLPAPQPAPQ